MKDLLFLAHRIPYPPNKGDKVRSYHLLRHLAGHYRVYLGAFIDDPADAVHAERLQAVCAQTCLPMLNPVRARGRSLLGLLGPRPLTLAYYRDAGLAEWVRRVLARGTVERIVVFSSAMAQYVPADTPGRLVVDFVDVDSDKWSQYARRRAWPASWVYGREGETLLTFERETAERADASVFVSANESELFRRLAPESAAKVTWVNNGVDLDYFVPYGRHPSPYPEGVEAVAFTGAMDYWANADAVSWFAREVFPAVRSERPRARFYVVGSRPTSGVQRLGELPGVQVTGTVPDVRPYLAHARVAVAPLRIGRGVQNKVLEAMAMARPVVATATALQGIEPAPVPGVLPADDAATFARQVLWCLADPTAAQALGEAGRAAVERHYDWGCNLARFTDILEGDWPGPLRASCSGQVTAGSTGRELPLSAAGRLP